MGSILKILSFNLCISWKYTRRTRLVALAKFILENEVDVLLFQEGVRSCFIYNTGQQLRKLLGEGWEIYSKSNLGWPFFWEFRVGIISRLPLRVVESKYLEVPQTDWLDAIPLPWRKRAVATQVQFQDMGLVNLISVHLSSNPRGENDRERQWGKLLDWVRGLWMADVTILGGDFNALSGSPVVSYPASQGFHTVVPAPPDYIFIKGPVQVSGEVVFNDRELSDHAGVLVEIF